MSATTAGSGISHTGADAPRPAVGRSCDRDPAPPPGRRPADAASFGALLRDAAATWPDADMLVFPDRRLSYAALRSRAEGWARALVGLGVQPGDHVGILLASCPDFVEILFGIAMAGAVAVPVNARYQARELGHVLRDADLVALFTTGRVAETLDFVERVSAALPSLARAADPRALSLAEAPRLRSIICLDGPCGTALLPGPVARSLGDAVLPDIVGARIDAVRAEDDALILYTSGTTASPKGAVMPHRTQLSNSRALGERYRAGAEDRLWSPLPIFHIAGIQTLMTMMGVGGAYLTVPYFDAGVALEMLERERATIAYPSFVTIMQDLVTHPRFEGTDLSSLRLMNSNFAVQPPWIRDLVCAALPHVVQVGTYGLTEASGTVTTSRLDDAPAQRTGRCGVVMGDWEVRIVDPDDGGDCPADAQGEIAIRGPGLLRGYHNAPGKTAESIRDGWFHTGDIGSLDADGQLMFHGRTKDMLKVGGENVAAVEIEEVLQSHPAVTLAQVVGVPHPRYVEVAAAFVELAAGARVDEAALIAHCHGKIASFKVPRHVRIVTDWPMSTSKIQKFRLRERMVAELAAAGDGQPG